MLAWEYPLTMGQLVLDVSLVSVLFLIGTLFRRYIRFFQRFLIPNNLIAGFLGLLLGPELLAWLDLDPSRMGVYVYHLLALTFISVGLRGGNPTRSKGAIHFGFIQIVIFLIQGLIGLVIALLLWWLVFPELVPAIGLLLPLGFGMGPGIAFTIGDAWSAYGYLGGGATGLTLAALGFLVAYFSGMVIVNRGIAKGNTALGQDTDLPLPIRTGIRDTSDNPIGARLTFFSGAIEPLTFHLALVGGIYALSYGVTVIIAKGMQAAGLGNEVPTLWSFQFILANLLALVVRKGFTVRRAAYVLNEGFLNRITGLFADYLIAFAIIGISLELTASFLLPILLMASLGGWATYLSIKWMGSRVFTDHPFERFVGIYGEMTGTISSGLALLRVTDPEFSTPVAQDLVLGSGMALILGFPLLILINLPFSYFEGALKGYVFILLAMLVYLGLIGLLWWRMGKSNLNSKSQ